ncbi:hypothetical protein AXG93_2675s1230 [Marchantia polymorpha subsp. ruderalis]|uniref:Uncharacterized protein n=1 Tax=Marchantia polymorpha subsp. ruderalis TaxID=1480154 RepID=A0A176VP47_MARPO|nr:hypothetical protein AXG93_2675s1230 [Marchantia polymorpha subsp. ruderalis]
MPFFRSRKREDGTFEKNMILKKIYKDFGGLGISYGNPCGRTYSRSYFPLDVVQSKKSSTPLSPPRTADSTNKYEPYRPKGTPRYSKIDNFIDNLNEACAALSKPMVEEFGRVRPQTLQSQPKRGVSLMEKVEEIEPERTEVKKNAPVEEVKRDEQCSSPNEDTERSSPMESGCIPVLKLSQISTWTPPKMPLGPWGKARDGGKWKSERKVVKSCPEDDDRAFEKKKRMEVVKAATTLQSRYRGYRVRRSQPLKYLLMIGSAKKRLQELKQQFNAWKIAVWFPTDHSERLAMTENVMNLLIKLDSIQNEVDAFLDHNSKHGALFDFAGNEIHARMQRPKSRTQTRTSSGKAKYSSYGNEQPMSPKATELKRHLASMGDFSGAQNSNDSLSTAVGEVEDSEAEGPDQIDRIEPEASSVISPEAATAAVELKEISPVCPQGPVEPETGADDGTIETDEPVSVVCPEVFDIFIPQREDCSRNAMRKKKYAVRFEDAAVECENICSVQPYSATEEDLNSENEDSHIPGSSRIENDVLFWNCSDDSERGELTDTVVEHRDRIDPSFEKPESLSMDAGDGAEGEKSQCGSIGQLNDQVSVGPCITVHVHNGEPLGIGSSGDSEKVDCLNSDDDVSEQSRLRHQALMADIRNASVNRCGGVSGEANLIAKSRFHSEQQSHLRTTAAGGYVGRPGHNHVTYEGFCNSLDTLTESECSEALDGVEEQEGTRDVPPSRQEQRHLNDCDLALGSPRFRTNCADFQSMRISPRNTFDDRTSDADAEDIELESDVEMDGVPEVENVSCCSDCARPPGHYTFERWGGTCKEELLRLRHACEESPREVQEEYIPTSFQIAESLDEVCRPKERFDRRELDYCADSYTQKLRKLKEGGRARTSQSDSRCTSHRPEKPLLLQKPSSVPDSHVKRIGHKKTSVIPSTGLVCSKQDRTISPPRSRSRSPYRQFLDPDGSKGMEAHDADEIEDSLLLTKLVDDNKRLKGLLNDVMNWNKAQATAMVSMTERIQHLEGLNILT